MKASEFIEYIEENDLPKGSLGFDEVEDFTKVTVDSELFANCYLKSFNQLYKDFSECDNKDLKIMLSDNAKYHKQFLYYVTKLNAKLELGKTNARISLLSYFNNNFQELNKFFDFILDVYEVDVV